MWQELNHKRLGVTEFKEGFLITPSYLRVSVPLVVGSGSRSNND